jgi:hypothetical protein
MRRWFSATEAVPLAVPLAHSKMHMNSRFHCSRFATAHSAMSHDDDNRIRLHLDGLALGNS